MGQKGSKARGILRKSPASSASSPLNNATYWEAEEDPDWDHCVMVVATQKSRQRQVVPDADDPLARSLHKDIDYPAVNVSRRSPDQLTPPPLPPDSRYPDSGQRKRHNTLLDTGWHACFKNNNYVFVRNGSATKSDRKRGDKRKDVNSDVTFVIATTEPEKVQPHQKLVVSLRDTLPKIKRTALEKSSPQNGFANGQASASPDQKQNGSSGKKSKKSDKKKSSWLKKLTPNRNKLKIEGTADETTPIFDSSPDDSPESCENGPSSPRPKEIIRISPHDVTPVKVVDLIGVGPQTSTPKYVQDSGRMYRTLPRGGPTPHRPADGRYSVRRRLPYDITELDESQSSPLSTTISKVLTTPHMDIDLSPLQKRASSHRKIIESPKFQNRLHPTDSMSDIPYADSVEDVFEDRKEEKGKSSEFSVNHIYERPRPRSDVVPKASFDESFSSRTNRTSSSDALSNLSFDESSRARVRRTYSSELVENVSFDERPRPRASKANKLDCAEFFAVDSLKLPPRQKISRSNTVAARPRPRGRCFSEPVDERALGSLPEMRSYAERPQVARYISNSEPSLRIRRAQSCRFPQNGMSPMEEEENKSLNEPGKKLLRSPDDSTVTFSPYAIPKKSQNRDNPVCIWLKELRWLTESECLNALQAKEIIKEDWIANALAVGNAQEKAESIWESGNIVVRHIDDMIDTLKKPNKLSSTPFSLKVAQFCTGVVELLKMGTRAEGQLEVVEARIKQSCAQLLEAVDREDDTDKWKKKMVTELQTVKESLTAIMKQLLSKQLQVIVECVDKATNINSLKRAVFALILLGRLDSTFCDVVVRQGAVRSLLSIIVESKWKEMHPCALRALTVLSCVPVAIKSFEECGGVDCVCDVLCERNISEGAKSEAAGVIAQITAPWTEGNAYVLPSINQNAGRLVKSIANLAANTASSEVFLLSSAALANLSFADEVLRKMKEHRVLEILVESCRSSIHASSLFIKDQVATVLANMAAKEEYRLEITTGGSLVLLLCFLQLRPSVGHGAPQLGACERIQQKAAIALARLCTNPETSNIVAEMQGIQRLVKLCKDRKERNDSDSVLVACLAALRKIAAVRQKEEVKKLGAQELIEPRLWDAFIAHSSKRESYV